ncbi:MOLPALP family lipoprotein [Spiroplasma gladiatoris]|uniref:MOLPALP family lipoprotein n=1 Tax=Spiroplasma gladiatoris TaxID=2143 RepID=A0A4P7AGN6_9MOLU|nr:hypothetical protein [Spiroplasma gladiatoris]QBQ07574.1 MOLPALP family lipoprotein [Spiroplasma gladiatoris]
MKKILGILSSIAISSSVFSITSCSLVNYQKQYTVNKVKSIADIASVASRSAILNDVQEIDVDYLNGYIGSEKMVNNLPGFNATKQAKTSDYINATFEDPLDRKFYNSLKDQNAYNLKSNLSPNSYADSIIDGGSTALAAIKSAGGIKPSLGGILESLLPQVSGFLSENGTEFKIDNNALNSLKYLSPYAQQLINDFKKTGLISIICRMILNINFINHGTIDPVVSSELIQILLGQGGTSTEIPFILEEYINEVMLSDFKGSYELTDDEKEEHPGFIQTSDEAIDTNLVLTPKVIQQSALVRLNKLLIRLSGRNYKEGDSRSDIEDQLKFDNYHPIVDPDWFRKSLGENIAYLIKNKDKLNYIALIEKIPDILYIVCSLVINLGVIDFQEMEDKLGSDVNSENLFYLKSKTLLNDVVEHNKDFLTRINDQKGEDTLIIESNYKKDNREIKKVKFSVYTLLKNLQKAIYADDKNGYNMQRIFFLLMYSNANRSEDNKLGTDYKLSANANLIDIVKLGALTGGMFSKEVVGVDSFLNGVIQGVGYKILDLIDGVEVPSIIKGLGGKAISRLAGVVLDTISNDRNAQGIASLIQTINTFVDTGINISEQSFKKLEHGFRVLWDQDSTLITELTGKKVEDKPINFINLINMDFGSGVNINEVLKAFSNSFESDIDYKNNKEKNKKGKVQEGINTLVESLSDKSKIAVYYKKDVSQSNSSTTPTPVKDLEGTSGSDDGKYNLMTVALALIKFPGYAIKDSSSNKYYSGTKGALYAMGYVEGEKTFRKDSPLFAAETIFDDSGIIKIRDSALNDFKAITEIKKLYIKEHIAKYTDAKNFSYKLVSYSDITDNNKYGKIRIRITYTSPDDKKEYTYEVNLLEYVTKKSWTIESIRKI